MTSQFQVPYVEGTRADLASAAIQDIIVPFSQPSQDYPSLHPGFPLS